MHHTMLKLQGQGQLQGVAMPAATECTRGLGSRAHRMVRLIPVRSPTLSGSLFNFGHMQSTSFFSDVNFWMSSSRLQSSSQKPTFKVSSLLNLQIESGNLTSVSQSSTSKILSSLKSPISSGKLESPGFWLRIRILRALQRPGEGVTTHTAQH